MEKEFIPYEQALALKELGFDEPCFGYWSNWDVQKPFLLTCELGTEKESCVIRRKNFLCSAPTFSQAFRWFREKYNIHHTIYLLIENPKVYEGSLKNNLGSIVFMKESTTYEKTELECLKKLIEIVKGK